MRLHLITIIITAVVCILEAFAELSTARLVMLYCIVNVCFFLIFMVLGKRHSFLAPLNIFGVSYFVHGIFGQMVWLLFNNEGNPIISSRYFFFISFGFLILAFIKYQKQFPTLLNHDTRPSFRYSQLTSPLILLILSYIGAYLYTSGFTVIPILASNIDETRFALMQEKGSRGIGSVLLLAGIHGIYRLRISKLSIWKKVILYSFYFIPFLLYGGRLLLLLPIIVISLPLLYKLKFSFLSLWKGVVVFSVFLLVVNYFGTVRQFGSFSLQSFVLYSWGDSFNEFQHLSHSLIYGQRNFGDQFLPTFFSSFFPSGVFELVGLDKDDFYVPIGYIVNQNTIFEKSPEIGIRISLFGEYLVCNPILCGILVGLTFWIIFIVDRRFSKNWVWTFEKYICMLAGLFAALAIPYGLSFLSLTFQFLLFTWILFRFKIKT
jgi:hypothetical protein